MTNPTPDQIIVEEPSAPPAPPAPPSRDEVKQQGWSKAEMDAAEKRGMIAKPEEPKAAPKAEEPKAAPKAEEPKAAPKAEEPKAAPKGSSLPDYKFTAEEQAVVEANFGKGHPFRAFYFRAKNERHGRQASEARALAAEEKNRLLEARLQALESGMLQPPVDVDANGQPIDPETQPLTLKVLKEMRQKEAEEAWRQEQAQNARVQHLQAAHREQEEYARSLHEDFDQTVDLAKDLMQNLDTLVPEKWKQDKVVRMVRELQVAAREADQIGLDGYHAAIIAYELGQMHPKYGQATAPHEGEQTGTKDPKQSGSVSPEQMKRIAANTQRRAPSAGVSGEPQKRVLSPEDVDLGVLNKMSVQDRLRFREKHPDLYAKLLRG